MSTHHEAIGAVPNVYGHKMPSSEYKTPGLKPNPLWGLKPGFRTLYMCQGFLLPSYPVGIGSYIEVRNVGTELVHNVRVRRIIIVLSIYRT